MVAEGAYGQLKGRWRVLLRKSESSVHIRTITLACVVLHHICITQGDSISRKLDLSITSQDQEKRNRGEIRKILQMR